MSFKQRKKNPIKPPTPLELKWEAILEKEGLGNLEHRASGNLKLYDSHYFKARYSKEEFQETETYYKLARELLFQDVFNDQRDKKIWALHSEGYNNYEIVRILKNKVSVATVERRIAVYRKYVLHT